MRKLKNGRVIVQTTVSAECAAWLRKIMKERDAKESDVIRDMIMDVKNGNNK